jgi:hypothetical protein
VLYRDAAVRFTAEHETKPIGLVNYITEVMSQVENPGREPGVRIFWPRRRQCWQLEASAAAKTDSKMVRQEPVAERGSGLWHPFTEASSG